MIASSMTPRAILIGLACLCALISNGVAGSVSELKPLILTMPFNCGQEAYWFAERKDLLAGQLSLRLLGGGVTNESSLVSVFGDGKVGADWQQPYTNGWIPEAPSASFILSRNQKLPEGVTVEVTFVTPSPLAIFYDTDRRAVVCSGTYVATGIVTSVRQQNYVSWFSRWDVIVAETQPFIDVSHPLIRSERAMSAWIRNTKRRTETRRYRIAPVVVAEYLAWLKENGKVSDSDVASLQRNQIAGIERILTLLGYGVSSALNVKDEKKGIVDLTLRADELEKIEAWVSPKNVHECLLTRLSIPADIDKWGRP